MEGLISRDPRHLHPTLLPLFTAHMAACAQAFPGPYIEVFPTCTARDNAAQAYLYSLGRTRKSHVGPWSAKRPLGSAVTRARAGQSAHNVTINGTPASCAYDVAISVAGRLVWDAGGREWQRVITLGRSIGLETLSFEAAHFQLRGWAS